MQELMSMYRSTARNCRELTLSPACPSRAASPECQEALVNCRGLTAASPGCREQLRHQDPQDPQPANPALPVAALRLVALPAALALPAVVRSALTVPSTAMTPLVVLGAPVAAS